MLPTIRLHDLRHTHATLALQAGVHPKVVSERLGHATISSTLDTYAHAIPAMQESAAVLIAGWCSQGSRPRQGEHAPTATVAGDVPLERACASPAHCPLQVSGETATAAPCPSRTA